MRTYTKPDYNLRTSGQGKREATVHYETSALYQRELLKDVVSAYCPSSTE